MNVLPPFLYLFQTIPIHTPTSYFRKLCQMFSKFIWKSARPRIRYEILSLPKVRGGAGALDASLYYKAAILTRILDWFHHSSSKLWVQIKNHYLTLPARQFKFGAEWHPLVSYPNSWDLWPPFSEPRPSHRLCMDRGLDPGERRTTGVWPKSFVQTRL